jgi:putative redox protein
LPYPEVGVVDIYMRYEGGLHCSAVHGPSTVQLATDAPRDNQGKGESFSPTDLVATALGTCLLTTMGIAARRNGWNLDGIELHVKKEMTRDPPRRIERLTARFTVPAAVSAALDAQTRSELEHIAHTCPVALSLHQTVDVDTVFGW